MTNVTMHSPRRVLHVFGSLARGGAERRTLEIVRRLDPARYAVDVCVLSGRPGPLAGVIETRGGHVLPCGLRPLTVFPMHFLRLLHAGRYDVVHSHVHQFSGVILALSALARVPVRVAHLWNTNDGCPSSRLRRTYRWTMRHAIDCFATRVIGNAGAVMEAFWGPGWRADVRRMVVYDGVDVGDAGVAELTTVRQEFGLPSGTRLLIHVARFDPQKNHLGLVDIAAALVGRRRDAVFLLVGEGPLRDTIERTVAARGLTHVFRFAGARDDVPRLLRASDLFILPSLWEGVPGAVLEALAAGLPVVASPLPGIAEIAAHGAALATADPGDAEAFAGKIAALLEGGAVQHPIGLPNAFSIARALEQVVGCYQ